MAETEGSKTKSTIVKWPKILLLGDSHTQSGYEEEGCWVSIVSAHFQRRCDIVNRGFDGYNSRWIKEMLPKLINEDIAKECAAVTILLGSNDANTTEQHVPLDEYKSALECIVHYITGLGVDKENIILISPPPLDEQLWREHLAKKGRQSGLFTEHLVKYATACCQVSRELEVACIDLYTEMSRHQDWKKFVNNDGLHLAKSGGQLLAELLIPRLDKICLPCKQIFPEWSDVDYDNPAKTFQ